MTALIAFLETAGRHGAAADFAARVAALPTDDATRSALLRGDVAALGDAFGDNRTMYCNVRRDDPQEPDEVPGETPDETPADLPAREPGSNPDRAN